MLEVPAKFAEMITEQFKVQCTYAEKGCKEAIAFKVRQKNAFNNYIIRLYCYPLPLE